MSTRTERERCNPIEFHFETIDQRKHINQRPNKTLHGSLHAHQSVYHSLRTRARPRFFFLLTIAKTRFVETVGDIANDN